VNDFDEFFAEHYARVVGSLRLAGGSAGESDDAAQEAFAKALVRWRAVSAMARPATWVYVVAVRDLRRRGRAFATASDTAPVAVVPDHASAVVDATVVDDALAALPPRQRLAVVLRFHADLTVPEVGRVMRCSEGTVKSTLHAALARLRIELADERIEGSTDGS
jgi:RNA polymerase sigma-70 factor (ECF subfamily)